MEYQSWDFCEANCLAYKIFASKEGRGCYSCKAYQMHQWLQEQGYRIVKTTGQDALQEENDIQRASIQELSRQLAGTHAELSALRGCDVLAEELASQKCKLLDELKELRNVARGNTERSV